jgi:hypothetical protein
MLCQTCNVSLSTEANPEKHFTSKQHLSAVEFQDDFKENKLKSEFFCLICSVYASSYAGLLTHLDGEKHKKRNSLLLRTQIEQSSAVTQSPTSSSQALSDIQPQPLAFKTLTHCELCRLDFQSQATYSDHLNSEKHMKRVRFIDQLDEEEKMASNRAVDSQTNKAADFHTVKSELFDDMEPIRKKYLESDWCHCCFVHYTSEKLKETHLAGREHLKRFQFKEVDKAAVGAEFQKKYFCSVCFKDNSSERTHQVHLNSLAHLKQEEHYNKYLTRFSSGHANVSTGCLKIEKSGGGMMSKSKSMSFCTPSLPSFPVTKLPLVVEDEKPIEQENEKVVELVEEPAVDEAVLNESNNSFELNFKFLRSKACAIYDKFNIRVYESQWKESEADLQARIVSAKAMDEINEMKLNLFEMLDERMKENIAKMDSGFDQFNSS